MTRAFILAIDGPAGAGKSTVARRVAERLGWFLVDTGAIYRAVALLAKQRSLEEEAAIVEALARFDLRFEGGRVLSSGTDVTTAIREPDISLRASHVSAMPGVRRGLLDLQRRIALEHGRGAVLEGRDIGTVVFPDADLKIFLTASIEERARRRTEELAARGHSQAYADVLSEMRTRDEKDSKRAVAPLVAAADAIQIDTTGRDLESIVVEIESKVRARGATA
jgi:cytidylate kinase